MGRRAARVTRALATAGFRGAVLASDLPAANNPCPLWHQYAGSGSGVERRHALATLGKAGLVKYDADHAGVDAGVLAIRDWLLAVHARWYVTCHEGDGGATRGMAPASRWDSTPRRSSAERKCRACFRSSSRYVERILQARRRMGRRSFSSWFSVRPNELRLRRRRRRVGGGGNATAAGAGVGAARRPRRRSEPQPAASKGNAEWLGQLSRQIAAELAGAG
jgi:hypothetical protein